MTEILASETYGVHRAAALMVDGELVAFPTETVYGLGGDATNAAACARIFEAKGRPTFNPLIVHVPDLEAAEKLAIFDAAARDLAQAFWPGPLTLVLPLRKDHGLSDLVSAGLTTVAIRVPGHPLAQALIRAVGRPLAAPSANPSGRISPTSADHVVQGLRGRIAAVLDGGPCTVGVESTIIGTMPKPVLLRAGGLPLEAIEATMGRKLNEDTTPGKVQAPGQLASHYAPRETVRLNVTERHADRFLVGFGSVAGDISLSENGDLVEAASRLFAALHTADAQGKPIEIAPVPDKGLGRAINDRLRRAAAPRP